MALHMDRFSLKRLGGKALAKSRQLFRSRIVPSDTLFCDPVICFVAKTVNVQERSFVEKPAAVSFLRRKYHRGFVN